MKYIIKDYNRINDKMIDDSIFQEEKVDFVIIDREDQIDHLIDWIGEAKGNDKEMMKEDLKYLISISDEFILSSILTNEYLRESEQEGQEILKEIYNY